MALCYALRGGSAEAEAALAEQRRRRVQAHLADAGPGAIDWAAGWPELRAWYEGRQRRASA